MEKDEFFELVKSSRTYRRYDGKPVGENVLRDLVDAARMAPTGNNTQLLRFCVVGEESPAKSQLVFSHLHWAGALKDWDGPEVYQRPGGYVVICAPAAAATNPIRLLDVGIAAQTVALAAAARGLGCCMHKSYDAVLGDELGLTEGPGSGLGYLGWRARREGRARARRRGRRRGARSYVLARGRRLAPRSQAGAGGPSRLKQGRCGFCALLKEPTFVQRPALFKKTGL